MLLDQLRCSIVAVGAGARQPLARVPFTITAYALGLAGTGWAAGRGASGRPHKAAQTRHYRILCIYLLDAWRGILADTPANLAMVIVQRRWIAYFRAG